MRITRRKNDAAQLSTYLLRADLVVEVFTRRGLSAVARGPTRVARANLVAVSYTHLRAHET